MGKVRLFDNDVEECFDKSIAVYFEALRYRAQLYDEGVFFPFSVAEMTKRTGLTYKQQWRAHQWLEGLGERKWIETKRLSTKGKNVLHFRVTDFAYGLINQTVRRYDVRTLKQKVVNNLGSKHNKRAWV